MNEAHPIYSKDHPFSANLKDRYGLTRPGSIKNTQHLVVDIRGSGIHYKVGDSLAIFPENDPEVVARILALLSCDGSEIVHDKRKGEDLPLRDFLSKRANLARVNKRLIQALVDKGATAYSTLLDPSERTALTAFTDSHQVWDTLLEASGVRLEPQEFCETLLPMIPRFYSIASSPLCYPEEVHLTIAVVQFESNGHPRKGVATHFLCHLAKPQTTQIQVYLQPTRDFVLPESPETPIIMVGPGTGIAPFVAFMQERVASGASGGNWLFFGECHRKTEFYYQDYWETLRVEGKLRLDTAFSRDQEEKVYVQHRLEQNGAELWSWLKRGAIFYVCGDAQRMAKDVETTLLQIAEKEGQLSVEEAKAWLKQLRRDKRYLRDVY